MIKRMALLATAAAISFYSLDSSAQIFTLRALNYGGLNPGDTGYSTIKNLVDTELQKIQDEINDGLPSAPPDRLMEGMANSSVFAGKGIGTDYASNMKVMLLGVGVGAGADLAQTETSTDGKKTMSGVGVAPGLLIGANLGFMDTARILGMDTNRLNMFLNFASYNHKQNISDKPGEESDAKLDMMAFGANFRYDWIKGNGNKFLGWGGVKFNFGYQYNKTNIAFNSRISKDVDETTGTLERVRGTVLGNPEATINVATHSIPIALSTDVQLLYILSLYTGVGADYSWGEARGKGNLNAEQSTLNCTGGAICGTPRDIDVQAAANIDSTGKVNPLNFRGFAGVQINLPFIRIFGQVDKSLGSELVGATAGLRFVY